MVRDTVERRTSDGRISTPRTITDPPHLAQAPRCLCPRSTKREVCARLGNRTEQQRRRRLLQQGVRDERCEDRRGACCVRLHSQRTNAPQEQSWRTEAHRRWAGASALTQVGSVAQRQATADGLSTSHIHRVLVGQWTKLSAPGRATRLGYRAEQPEHDADEQPAERRVHDGRDEHSDLRAPLQRRLFAGACVGWRWSSASVTLGPRVSHSTAHAIVRTAPVAC